MSSGNPFYYNKKNDRNRKNEPDLRLIRLLLALGLFVTLCFGKQVAPQGMYPAGEKIVKVIGTTTDLDAVFAHLGESIANAENRFDGLEEFCIAVFGGQEKLREQEQPDVVFYPDMPADFSGILGREVENLQVLSSPGVTAQSIDEEPILAVGCVELEGESDDASLPEGHTADKLSLGMLKTVTPLLGSMNSGYGFRTHPVTGVCKFHSGTDISGNSGDPIGAFADGIVEYIGENDTHGLYLQLDHGNEIKSFYAHCSSLCVTDGQQVRAGEMIARVGDTGISTGPHLHLELKCCGTRVDPSYYIDFK